MCIDLSWSNSQLGSYGNTSQENLKMDEREFTNPWSTQDSVTRVSSWKTIQRLSHLTTVKAIYQWFIYIYIYLYGHKLAYHSTNGVTYWRITGISGQNCTATIQKRFGIVIKHPCTNLLTIQKIVSFNNISTIFN